MNSAQYQRAKHGDGIHGLVNYRATFKEHCPNVLTGAGHTFRSNGAPRKMNGCELVRIEHRVFALAAAK